MTRAETLDRAKQCVCGQRENEYGSPEDNFRSIAALWSVYKNTDFTATDGAVHFNQENLRLLVIRGPSLMKLVHALYERAADEA